MAFLDKFKEKKEAVLAKTVAGVGLGRLNFFGSWKPKQQWARVLRKFDLVSFLGRRERIGGLTIREKALELALFENITTEDGTERKQLSLHEIVALDEGTIVEGVLLRPESLRLALDMLYKKAAKFSLESLIVSIPSGLANFVSLTFPVHLSREQVEGAIRLAAESSFPLQQDQLYVDWVISEAGHYEYQKQEAIVGMGKKFGIESYLDAISQSGFSSIAVETHSMSLARILTQEPRTRMALFREPSEALIVVYDQGIPHLQVQIPQAILGGEGASAEEKLTMALERVSHSALAGEERLLVADLVKVFDEKVKDLPASPVVKISKLPKESSLASALQLPDKELVLRDGWMAVALGAALRGLIPRRLDTLISFMPIGTEVAYERARLLSLVDFLQKFSMSFGVFLLVVFAAGLFFVNFLGKNIENAIKGQAAVPVELVELKKATLSFNQKVNAIDVLDKKMPLWERLFSEVDRLAGTGISLRKIEAPSPSMGFLVVDGVASSRDALLLLKSTLENSLVFQSDPLPTPLFLEKENITFSLRLKLKDPDRFFP